MQLVLIGNELNHPSDFLSSIDSAVIVGSTMLLCDYLLELDPLRAMEG